MTNPKFEANVELEEGEIEDDGCEVESGVSDTNDKIETKAAEEDAIQEKLKDSNDIKTSKKSSKHGKEKTSDYNGKKKYAASVKTKDWTDMLYDNDYDENESNDYSRELEEVRMKLRGENFKGPYDSPSEDEDAIAEEKYLRPKKFDDVDDLTTHRHHIRNQIDKKSKIPCKFFFDGNCMKGEDCSFSHDRNVKIRDKDICKSYRSLGYCSFGKKCRYLHIDENSLKTKKESRKRKGGPDDCCDQPPKKKIPSLFDIKVTAPEGQSDEDIGQALMIAAKRSVSQKAKIRKPSLLGSPPENAKRYSGGSRPPAKKFKPRVDESDNEMMDGIEEENRYCDANIASPENNDFGPVDKDERQLKSYHDIDERQNLPPHVDHSNVMVPQITEEQNLNQPSPPINNIINTKALLGDAPAPINPCPPRGPLLGNAPANFNPNFPQFPRPALIPSPPQLINQAIGQAINIIFNQNLNVLQQQQQTRMINPVSGLLPHPINPPRGPGTNYNQRPPFGPNVCNNVNSNLPMQSFMTQANQLPNNQSLLPVPLNNGMNMPRSLPYHQAPVIGQFNPSSDPRLQLNDLAMSNSSLHSFRGVPRFPLSSENQIDDSVPSDEMIAPIYNQNSPLGQDACGRSEAAGSGCGDAMFENKKTHNCAANLFDHSTKSNSILQDFSFNRGKSVCTQMSDSVATTSSTQSNSVKDDVDCIVGGVNVNFLQPAQRDLYLKMCQMGQSACLAEETKENISTIKSSIEIINECLPASQVTTGSNESKSVSLTIANEVSFDCKLKGPYSLQTIDVNDTVVLPHFINPHDTKWSGDPRVQKHKNDLMSKPLATKAQTSSTTRSLLENYAILPPKVTSKISSLTTEKTMLNPPQTRDPRLLRRSKKNVQIPIQTSNSDANTPLTSTTPPSNSRPGELESLAEFLKRYSSLPFSETNTAIPPPLSDNKAEPEQKSNSASEAMATSQRPYQNLVTKKSSNNVPKLSKPYNYSSENDDGNLEDSKKSKQTNSKDCLEFQSPLVSPAYRLTSTFQYGIPPARLQDINSQKSLVYDSNIICSVQDSTETLVPNVDVEGFPFITTPSSYDMTTNSGSLKNIFKKIDPTASPFC